MLDLQQFDVAAAGAVTGDEAAISQVFAMMERPLFSYLYRLLDRDVDAALDLVQQTWLKALPHLRERRVHDGNLRSWLFTVATSLAIDMLRRRQKRPMIPWDPASHEHLLAVPEHERPDALVERHEGRAAAQLAVGRTLDRMGQRHRLALILREYDGLSCEEIGEVLGMSRSAVKSMLFRAREEFRSLWQADETVPPVEDRRRRRERPAAPLARAS